MFFRHTLKNTFYLFFMTENKIFFGALYLVQCIIFHAKMTLLLVKEKAAWFNVAN